MKKINDTIINERVSTTLSTHDFYYDLPEELIAQFPSEERDMCRLMVLDRRDNSVEHKVFKDIIDYLNPEDMLVVNSSKVIPARLLGTTEKTGASMELLLLRVLVQQIPNLSKGSSNALSTLPKREWTLSCLTTTSVLERGAASVAFARITSR